MELVFNNKAWLKYLSATLICWPKYIFALYLSGPTLENAELKFLHQKLTAINCLAARYLVPSQKFNCVPFRCPLQTAFAHS